MANAAIEIALRNTTSNSASAARFEDSSITWVNVGMAIAAMTAMTMSTTESSTSEKARGRL